MLTVSSYFFHYFLVFIILFTVVFGRIFCGWMCPQTIFMEMVFRKVEYLIEGDRSKQIKLDKQKWDAEKIKKKARQLDQLRGFHIKIQI